MFMRAAAIGSRGVLTLFSHKLAQSLANLLIIGALAFLVLANPALLRTVTLLAGFTVPSELPPNDWNAARPVLEPLIDEVEVVVTTDDLRMLYYYGHADYLLSASKFGELPAASRQPFGRDVRTDVSVIADARSLEVIMRCHASGLFVTQTQHWIDGARRRAEVTETAPLLDRLAAKVELPARSRLIAFVWRNEPDASAATACAELREPTN